MTSYTKMNVCIRDVSKSDWLYIKSTAAKTNKTIAELLSKFVAKDRAEPKGNWGEILNREPLFTEAEAADVLEASKMFRAEFRFR